MKIGLIISALVSFANVVRLSENAKNELSAEDFDKLKVSHDKIIKNTILFLLLVTFPMICIACYFLMGQPFTKSTISQVMPADAMDTVCAHVTYDEEFYFAYDSKVYRFQLADYELSSDTYNRGDAFNIYIDKDKNIVGMDLEDEVNKASDLDMKIAMIFFIGSILVVVCIHLPICYCTYGKTWRKFAKEN